MNRQSVDLGFVLRQFPDLEFGMHTFDHRLRMQKFVYLMQSFDVYLGYDYSWYLRGPYCSTLAASGFSLAGFYADIPSGAGMHFSSALVQDRFDRFKRFVRGHENDNAFLEIAASLHFLEGEGDLGREEVLDKVVKKRPEFTKEQCVKVRSYLEKWGRTGGGVKRPAGEAGVGRSCGAATSCEAFVEVPALPGGLDQRPYDKGFYHMLLDSKEAGEKLVMAGRDIFRPGQVHPHVDEIAVDDTALLVRLVRG